MRHRFELQNIIDDMFKRLGNQRSFVNVKILDKSEILAGAIGLKLPNFPPIGEIFISEELINLLSSKELEFVLAHEVMHIELNHIPLKILTQLPKEMLKTWEKESKILQTLRIGIDSFKVLIYSLTRSIPPEAVITRDQEIQADIYAIMYLTRDKKAAISCLKKLVNNDLNRPSHLWEALDVKFPTMTMKERIEYIEQTFATWDNTLY